MSIATLLSQHHQVTAVDIIPEKVDMINNRKSPIQDDYALAKAIEETLSLDEAYSFLSHNYSCSSSGNPSGSWKNVIFLPV